MTQNKKAIFDKAKFDLDAQRYDMYLLAKWDLRANEPSPSLEKLKEFLDVYKNGPAGREVVLEISMPELRALHNVFGRNEMVRRMELAIEKDKYRPHNMRRFDFVASPDLDYVGGDVSTFDADLSWAVRNGVDDYSLRRLAAGNIVNLDEVVTKYASDWMTILQSHPIMVKQIMKNPQGIDKEQLMWIFQTFVADMLKRQGIKYPHLYVYVVDDWAEAPEGSVDKNVLNADVSVGGFFKLFKTGDSDVLKSIIVINRANQPHKDNFDLFVKLINALAHEYGHFVDQIFPNRGMLGAQVETVGKKVYIEGTQQEDVEKYHDNATEKSSSAIERALENQLRQKYGR